MPESVPLPPQPQTHNRRLLASLVAVCLISVTTAAGPGAPQETFPPPARSEGADSLHYVVKAGEVLIFALPASKAPRYSIVRAPALSWLYDRSFFWRTLPADAGEHVILFATTEDEAARDTLSVRVTVR